MPFPAPTATPCEVYESIDVASALNKAREAQPDKILLAASCPATAK